jgi:hypothetical protein
VAQPAAFVHSNIRKVMKDAAAEEVREEDLEWKAYTVDDLDLVTSLIDNELSEPYSIFTYRYFLNQWPQLCMLVRARPCYKRVTGHRRRSPAASA